MKKLREARHPKAWRAFLLILGSGNASIIGSIGPASTIILAYIFPGERLGWLQWAGTLLVIAEIVVITAGKQG